MPHVRNRIAIKRLEKKLKFSRVVSIQGARQTGKSVLARNLFTNGYYVTFDKAQERDDASDRIGTYLEELRLRAGDKTIVIDEAQKVPALFDQIKSIVDENQKPGQFLLLGSTEFSIEAQINESLTGRISRTKLFPLLLSETVDNPKVVNSEFEISKLSQLRESPYTRGDLVRFLENGGFPAIFSIRDSHERMQRLDEWVRLTCERDVLQLKKMKPDPELCLRILQILPKLEEPSAPSLAHHLKRSTKRIATQLKALLQIFAIHRIDPHPLGTGKPLYFLIDPGLVGFMGGPFGARLESALITEFLAKQSYQALAQVRFSYYRTTKGARIPLLIETPDGKIIALKWVSAERLDRRELAIMHSFSKKAKREKFEVESVILCGVSRRSTADQVTILPWEFVF